MRHPKDGADASGFTLIEVVVALAIAALGLGFLTAAVGTGLGNARAAADVIGATQRAQSHLAEIGVTIPLAPGERRGGESGGFSWHSRISPPNVQSAASEGGTGLALYPVEVTVSWQRGGEVKSMTLRSQRLGSVPADE